MADYSIDFLFIRERDGRNMKKSRIALSVILGSVVLASAVAVSAYVVANDESGTVATHPIDVAKVSPASLNENNALPVQSRGVIDSVKKTSFEPDRIDLSWEAADDADGYKIYICDRDESEDYVKAKEVTKPEVSIGELKSGTQYWIKIVPYATVEGEEREFPETVKKTATQAGEISGLRIVHSSDEMEIEWDKADGADSYRVYRSVEDGKYKLVSEIDDVEKTSFFDEDVEEGKLYTYKVCANRTLYDGVNYPSEGRTIQLVCGMSAPTDLIATSEASRVHLSWNYNSYATGYNIYIARGSDELEYFDATERNYYITDKFTPGDKYTFRVEPYYVISKGKEANGTYTTCSIEISDNKNAAIAAGSGTYIEISISQQHLWFYENEQLVLDTDVVTGNNDGECNTPTGRYSIGSRATNTTLTGPGYSSFVNYWLGFNGGIGIHDANWRSSFGGNIYNGNGSHGCVNTPYDKVKILYERTSYGTPVIVY